MSTSPQGSSRWRITWELWRTRKLSFLVVASAVMLTGLYLTFTKVPNVYETQAALTVRSDDRATRAFSARDFGSEITGPGILTPVAEGMGRISADTSSTIRQQTLEQVRNSLRVTVQSPSAGETEILLTSRGHDPDELVKLVNLTARSYVTECERKSKAEIAKTDRLRGEAGGLTAALDKAKASLDASKTALANFEAEHAQELTDSRGDPDGTLRQLIEQQTDSASSLEKVQTEATGLEAAEKLLQERLKTVTEFIETKEVTTVRDPERLALEREIRMMERQLEEMLKTYTFKHPEVIQMQTNLLMKRRQLRQMNDRVEDSVKQSKKDNPEYAVLKGKLDDAVVKLQIARSTASGLTAKQETLARRIVSLQQLVGSYRKLKNELAEADKQHQKAQTEAAAKNTELDLASKALEPVPVVSRLAGAPTVPVGPRRSLYVLGVLTVALVAGWTAMAASFRLGGTFASEFELSRVMKIPAFGTISAVAGTPADRRVRLRKHLRLGLLLGLAAIVTIAAVMILTAHTELFSRGG